MAINNPKDSRTPEGLAEISSNKCGNTDVNTELDQLYPASLSGAIATDLIGLKLLLSRLRSVIDVGSSPAGR